METMLSTAAGAAWSITLLGGLTAQYRDRRVTRFETRKAAALLACLAFYPHRSHPREELIEMLWPEEDLDATRLRFRQTLTTLRRALQSAGPDALLADRTYVRLNADLVITDVATFEAALKTAARQNTALKRVEILTQAVSLYRGELLPGFYDDWISGERARLAALYLDALSHLAKALGETGETSRAIEYARKSLAADPLREETHDDLIRLYAVAGRPSEALRQYRELEQALWKELRATPSPTVQEFVEALRSGVAVTVVKSDVASAPVLPIQQPGAAKPAETPGQAAPALPVPALAAPLTPFFGREPEIQWLTATLSPTPMPPVAQRRTPDAFPPTPAARYPLPATRLITLTGSGGAGKTRCALEVARRLQEAYRGAVWFLPLADRHDALLLGEAIADTVCPPGAPVSDPFRQAAEVLSRQPALLVLDNFEHLADTGGRFVRTLLERAPGLKCLVTSRQRLELEGEQEFAIAPLPVPDMGVGGWGLAVPPHVGASAGASVGESPSPFPNPQPLTPGAERPPPPDVLMQFPSVQLFVDRARKARPDFQLTEANAPFVTALCQRLEGLPLALELAAAWASVLSPAQMLERLSGRFDMLVSRRKDIEERHQSLRATLDWSCRRLKPETRRFLARLSVFRGGWTLEAAEALAKEEGGRWKAESKPGSIPPSSLLLPPLEALEQLRQHSLIFAEPGETEMRFRMLDTVREYAEELLSPEERTLAQQRHADYCRTLAETAERHLIGAEQRRWLDRLDAEGDNLRAALDWYGGEGADIESALRISAALWRFWDVRGHHVEGQSRLNTLLAVSEGTQTIGRARALLAAGNLACVRNERAAARPLMEESLALFRALDDRAGLAEATCGLADILCMLDETPRTKALFEESLSYFRELRDIHGIARALGGLAMMAMTERDYAAARSLYDKSAAMYRVTGHKKGMAWSVHMQGCVAVEQGDALAAHRRFEEAVALFRQLDDKAGMLHPLVGLGNLARRNGDLSASEACLTEAARLARLTVNPLREADLLRVLGEIADARGDHAAQDRYRECLHAIEKNITDF
jgi:predicted ATPase/DNA-binding SARP family transcriptional activator